MAGKAKGLHIRWRNGIAYARFTHEGCPFSLSTRERDPARATAEAARLYDGVVRRQRRPRVRPASQESVDDLTANWIADLEATHDARTAHEYDLVATKWADRWKTLGELTTSAIADYQRDRLRVVSRETVRKNLVQLRTFFAWCVEQGLIDEAPVVPKIPRRATGKRTRAEVERTPITPKQIARLLPKLPELGTTSKSHEQFRVRDWAIVAWETGLRPVTIKRLSTPEHFKKGDRSLRITAEIDKARWAREVPLTIEARAALERSLPDEPGLIFGSHDYREHLKRVSKRVLRRVVRPYDFRHSRITAWVAAGKDLAGIQFLAGHVDLSTTSGYVHPRAEAARRVLGARR